MRRRVLTALAIILVVSGAVWFILARVSLGGPIELPATRKALGLEVQLLDSRRLANGQIEVKLTIAGPGGKWPGPNVHIGETEVGTGNTQGECERSVTHDSPGRPMATTSDYTLDKRAKSIDLSLPMHIHRPNQSVSFRFNNVTTGSLPQTRTVGGYRVTLAAVYKNCTPHQWPNWEEFALAHENPPPCFGIRVATTLPEDFEGFDHPLLDCGGKRIELNQAWAQFTEPQITIQPNTLEQLVAVFSPTKATDMMMNRVRRYGIQCCAPRHQNGNYLYGFRPKDSPKGSFTFEIKGILPPDKKDTAVVTFENVPVR